MFIHGNWPRTAQADWSMAGANPERTSWVPEEVPGMLRPVWIKRIEPYISQKVQVVAADGTLYISTAQGLYALDVETGDEKWVYATELPLGHSPTVVDGVIYVGGFDRRIHALDTQTGRRRWVSAPAGAGFHGNPLVVAGKVVAGNRDGQLYAYRAEDGALLWRFATSGPVLFSPAYADSTVYFAANDSHAYAVELEKGKLVWKSAKLPGAGFHSWWPVVYQDRVLLAGSENYGSDPRLDGRAQYLQLFRSDLFPGGDDPGTFTKYDSLRVGPEVEQAGDWSHGRTVLDLSRSNRGTLPVTEYFERKPWRRTFFVLDRHSGKEVTYDFDKDGKPEYAPLVHCGTQTGNRYPPVVGPDGVLYLFAAYQHSGSYIPRGGLVGWRLDSPLVSLVSNFAVDEPLAYSAGGSLLYFNHCVIRQAGAHDLRQPGRPWLYFSYNLEQSLPEIFGQFPNQPGRSFGGEHGAYGLHGDQNPPVPYRGKVYMHRGNYLLAFGPDGRAAKLPPARSVAAQHDAPVLQRSVFQQRLSEEIEKILAAGHLRPGRHSAGFFDMAAASAGDELSHYFAAPSDTVYVLARALPHLSEALREKTKVYLRREFEAYPPWRYSHIGWKDGTPREVFDTPPEAQTQMSQWGPSSGTARKFTGWRFPPHANYALYQYAKLFGGAAELMAKAVAIGPIPSEDYLQRYPHVLNAYIAGCFGLLGLADAAGQTPPGDYRNQLDRLLRLRGETFAVEPPLGAARGAGNRYERALNGANNFMYLVPETARYLRQHALEKVKSAVTQAERVTPYWFVAKAEEGYGESALTPLWHPHALFQARALILDQRFNELERYVDVPAFAVGDLFYLDNLISLLDAE